MRAIIDKSFSENKTFEIVLESPIVSVKLQRIADKFTDSELVVVLSYENDINWWSLEEIFPKEPWKMNNVLMRVNSKDGRIAQKKFSYLTRSKRVLELAKGRLNKSAWLGSVFSSNEETYQDIKEKYRS